MVHASRSFRFDPAPERADYVELLERSRDALQELGYVVSSQEFEKPAPSVTMVGASSWAGVTGGAIPRMTLGVSTTCVWPEGRAPS